LDELARWTRPSHVRPEAAEAGEVAAATGAAPSGPPRPKFLDRVAQYPLNALAAEVQQWMLGWLAERVDGHAGAPSPDASFAELGLDSLTAVELNLEFEKVLGLRLPPSAAWSYPTPAALSKFLAESLLGVATGGGANGEVVDSWFQAMDADVQR
jgi:acyl carrier protein